MNINQKVFSMKKIRNINEAPDWFDCKRYEQILNETHREALIYNEISIRLSIYNHFKNTPEEPDVFGLKSYWSDIKKMKKIDHKKSITTRQYESGLISKEDFEKMESTPPLSKELLQSIEPPISPVSDKSSVVLTCLTHQAVNNIGLKEKVSEEFFSDPRKWLLSASPEESLQKIDFLTQSQPAIKRAQIVVDLTFSNSRLIKDFENILIEIRKEFETEGSKEKLKETDIEKIIRYRVISYLDLKIWELESEVSISNATMSELLFPEDYTRDSEFIRKTLIPFIQRMDHNYMREWAIRIKEKIT